MWDMFSKTKFEIEIYVCHFVVHCLWVFYVHNDNTTTKCAPFGQLVFCLHKTVRQDGHHVGSVVFRYCRC